MTLSVMLLWFLANRPIIMRASMLGERQKDVPVNDEGDAAKFIRFLYVYYLHGLSALISFFICISNLSIRLSAVFC